MIFYHKIYYHRKDLTSGKVYVTEQDLGECNLIQEEMLGRLYCTVEKDGKKYLVGKRNAFRATGKFVKCFLFKDIPDGIDCEILERLLPSRDFLIVKCPEQKKHISANRYSLYLNKEDYKEC